MTGRLTIEHLGGLPIITIERTDPKGWQFSSQVHAIGSIAAFFLIVLSPVLVGAAIAVSRLDGRPIFFRQRRVGLDERTFEIVKFRSMDQSQLADDDGSRRRRDNDERARDPRWCASCGRRPSTSSRSS